MSEASPLPPPHSTREDALAVVRRLRENGYVAYFAGGCVRDLLLGMEPKDFDVATDAPPSRVRELFGRTQAVGAAFGVILVHNRASKVEVATFRAEGGYQDGRHPSEVHFTTAEEDAKRRDFTINGLFYDPVAQQVIDHVGGQEDLRSGVIRAIGNPTERFDEDSLRLLRAVRFSTRLNFPIEPTTAAAIVAHAPELKRISPERIAEELRIMLTPPTRIAAWRLLWELELVHVLFRFLHIERQDRDVNRAFLFDQVSPADSIPFGLSLAAAVLCYRMQVEKKPEDARTLLEKKNVNAAARAMRQALRISNEESDQMSGTLLALGPLLRDGPPRVSVMKRFLAQPTASLSRKLLYALHAIGIASERIEWLSEELRSIEQTDFAPTPLIDGDVLTGLGLQPGPIFKTILDEAYDAQLERRITSRDEAVAMALKIAGR